MTLDDAIASFLAGLGCASTVRQYRYILARFREHCRARGVEQLADVASEDVLAFKAGQGGYAVATRTHRVAVVRTFLNTCERAGWIERSPAAHIRGEGGRSRRRHSTLTLEEQRSLIAAAHSERDQVLVTLLLATGARIGELCAARVSDWSGRLLRLDGKTGERFVPVVGNAASALEVYLAGRPVSSSAPLIGGRQGGLTTRQAQRIFRAACRRAGLAERGPHQARHAAATRWVVQGVPIMVVSELLGHARVSTTVDFYLHASEALMRQAVSDDTLLSAA